MDTTIDFSKTFDNEAEAEATVAKIKEIINSLTIMASASKDAAIDANKTAEEYRKQNELLIASNLDLADAIKAIHQTLSFTDNINSEEMKSLKLELAKFVLGSGSIKLGVLSNARKS